MEQFPSLSGTYISQSVFKLESRNDSPFPSPVGDLYFSIMKRFSPSKGFHMVSVPCRGLIFLNKKVYSCQSATLFPSPVGDLYFSINLKRFTKLIPIVSVPCRGLIFLNHFTIQLFIPFLLFPSPVGDLYFSIIREDVYDIIFVVSVPCRGLIFLNEICIKP